MNPLMDFVRGGGRELFLNFSKVSFKILTDFMLQDHFFSNGFVEDFFFLFDHGLFLKKKRKKWIVVFFMVLTIGLCS